MTRAAKHHPRVLVLAPRVLFESFFDAPRRARLARVGRWRRLPGRTAGPRVRSALREAEALVTTWDSPAFGEELLSLAPSLRIVAHCGAEVKGRFARPLFERLTIANAAGPMAAPVAELAVAFLLHAARRLDEYRRQIRHGSLAVYHDVHDRGAGAETLQGRRVGLLGFGRIGREAARLLRPFGARLSAHDPWVPEATIRASGATPLALRSLLKTSEFLVIAAGLTERTRGLLDRRTLRLLPRGATLVNVARGGIVETDALVAEVRAGRLRCALDVTDPLEPLPARHPLRRLEGAVVTPHVGAAGARVRHEIADILLDALERFFHGKRVPTRVSTAMLERTT
jgi:phosphoglycerate dehydrogenase-like enzyme